MKTIWITLVLCTSIAGAANPAQTAVTLLREGRFPEALTALTEAQREQPGNAIIQNLTGIALTQLGRIAEANDHYREAIHLAPKLAAAHKTLGFNLLSQKQYEAAKSEFNLALTLDPADTFSPYYLGMTLLATGQDRLAVEQLKNSEPLLLKDPDTALLFVHACVNLKDFDSAISLLNQLQNGCRLNVKQAYDAALLMSSKSQSAQAVQLFRYLMQGDPARWSNQYNLALALLDDHRPREAVPLLQRLGQERSDDANIFRLLGAALESAGDPSHALEAYDRALQLDPENPDRYLDYSRLLLDLDKFDESARLVQDGIAKVNDSYALQMRLGSVQMSEGKLSEARVSFGKALEQHPELPLGYVALARTYLLNGENEKALEILGRAPSQGPPDFLLDYFTGLMLERAGRTGRESGGFSKSFNA
ncbi:MAG: tetratricopeptide repeat protein [Acidobacteriota bacterium]|nr:tetratricopeptide repeat protein [Acidobacteriota bacterium]